MSQFGKTFSNPWVWGGGAAIGLVLLLRSSGANAEVSSSMDAVNPTSMSAAVANNAAVMGANIELAHIQADLGKTAYEANVAKQLGFYSLLKSIDDNNAMVSNQRTISQAGITNALITSSTAIIVDQSNNATRLGLAYEETAQAEISAAATTAVARYQYKAAKAVSKNNMIGSIVGSVGRVATAAFGGPTGGGFGF